MSVVASLLSIVLFLAFATAGIQKLQFTPVMAATSQRLGFSRSTYRRIGIAELLGAVAVLVGLASARGSLWGIVNEVAGAGLALTMLFAIGAHLRKGDSFRHMAPAATLGVVALVEVASRLF